MKNITKSLTLISALILASCSESIDDIVAYDATGAPAKSVNYEKISIEEAIDIANNFYNTGINSRAAEHISVDVCNVQFLTTFNSRANLADTLIYVLNYENDNGFAIISAKKSSSPILAVIDNGNFKNVFDTHNPMFDSFINSAKLYVLQGDSEYVSSSDTPKSRNDFGLELTPATGEKVEVDTLYRDILAPKLGDLFWGQKGYEGSLCPNSIAGCSPLAIAMACYHFKEPANIEYTYPEHEINSEIIPWSEFSKHSNNPKFGVCFTCSQYTHSSLARVIREIGYRAKTKYEEGASGTSTAEIKKTLTNVLNTRRINGFYDYSKDGIRNALKDGLVIISGRSGSYEHGIFTPNDDKGHTWIADGYRYVEVEKKKYMRDSPTSDWIFVEKYVQHDDLIHFNLGWNGNGNGYYSSSVFTIRNPNAWDSDEKEFYVEYSYFSDAKYLTIQ